MMVPPLLRLFAEASGQDYRNTKNNVMNPWDVCSSCFECDMFAAAVVSKRPPPRGRWCCFQHAGYIGCVFFFSQVGYLLAGVLECRTYFDQHHSSPPA